MNGFFVADPPTDATTRKLRWKNAYLRQKCGSFKTGTPVKIIWTLESDNVQLSSDTDSVHVKISLKIPAFKIPACGGTMTELFNNTGDLYSDVMCITWDNVTMQQDLIDNSLIKKGDIVKAVWYMAAGKLTLTKGNAEVTVAVAVEVKALPKSKSQSNARPMWK
jgi:hypothetical protein